MRAITTDASGESEESDHGQADSSSVVLLPFSRAPRRTRGILFRDRISRVDDRERCKGSGARIALLNDAIDGFPMTSSDAMLITTGRPKYQKKNGATRSAFGDVDGDGFDELIVGFHRRGRHEVQIFDDLVAGLRPMTADDGFISASDPSIAIIPTPSN